MSRTYSNRKQKYMQKLTQLLETYSKVLLTDVTNVGANHLATLRMDLRGESEVLMGKNTLIRKCLRNWSEAGNSVVDPLISAVTGNVGLVFTNGNLRDLRNFIEEKKKSAPAKSGAVAPLSVTLPAGPTGLEPTQTQFLQALNIPTKIVRGQVEILDKVNLIQAGERVKPGEAALLQRLGIFPFSYGMKVKTVYDNGFVYDAALLDTTDNDILAKVSQGVTRIASLGMALGYPCLATVPHTIIKAYQNMVGLCLETNYNIEGTEQLREMLANPEAFAAPVAEVKEEAAKEPTPEPSEESESEDMELDLFG